ncbi:MAG TPA: hypothetical protein VK563_00185 [Puia sp.]|nr:hypothetical protein [Puia sp.]
MKVAVKDEFASFSSVENGFKGYLHVLESNFSNAYDALTHEEKTFDDFVDGLKNGDNGPYGTDIDYGKKLKENFESVVADYERKINSDITQTTTSIRNIIKDKRNYTNYERALLTREATGRLLQLLEQNYSLRNDLNSLEKLK